jgi:hypothetical protein
MIVLGRKQIKEICPESLAIRHFTIITPPKKFRILYLPAISSRFTEGGWGFV